MLEPKIRVRDLSLFYGQNQALKGINMDIAPNTVTAFIGPSGCGKSTFLKTLNRMNDLVEGVKITGSVELDGENIYSPNVDTTVLRRRVGMVFQQPNPFPMSIYDNVAYGPRVHGIRSKQRLDDIVEESLRGAAIFDEVKDRLKKSALGLSGGQPMQVVAMRADGIPVAVSTVVLAVVTILYKLVLVLLGAAVCILKPRSLMVYLEPALPLIRLGMALNVVFIGALLLVVFHPGLARAMVGGFLSFLSRFRLFRNTEHSGKRLERILEQYQGTAVFFRQHRHLIFRVFVITVLQRMSLFLVTWFTYKSFGLHGHSLGQIVFLQAMISVAADMLPLPGGMGISEAMFLDIFGGIFGSALLLPAMVISRGISYYTQLVLCGLVTAAAAIVQGLKNRKVN